MAGLRKSRHLALVGAALLAVGFGSGSALGQEAVGGNINSCTDLGSEYLDASALVTITSNDLTYLSYTATEPVVLAIKGGDNYNVYPAATEGVNLHAPLNGGGNVPRISHFFFCIIPAPEDPSAGGDGEEEGSGSENGGQTGSDNGNASGDGGQTGNDSTDQGGSDQGQDPDANGETPDDNQVEEPGEDPGQNDSAGDGSGDNSGTDDGVTDGVTDEGDGTVDDPDGDPATDGESTDGGTTGTDDGSTGTDDGSTDGGTTDGSTDTDDDSTDDGSADDGSTDAPQDGEQGSVPSSGSETGSDPGETVTTLPVAGIGAGDASGLNGLVLAVAALLAAMGAGIRRIKHVSA